MLHLIRYIKGYVCIRISGYSPQRFMNLCRNNGILLWDIKPDKQDYILKMSILDFKTIKSFSRKTKVKAVIIKKYGLPFFMYKNKKRKVFMGGIPICLFLLYLLTKFIWAFDFRGNNQITDDMLIHFLEKNDVKIGTYIPNIPIEELEAKIREEYSCVTWTSLKMNGTELVIEISENDIMEQNILKEDKGKGKHIVAMEDGVIVSIITRKGVPQTKEYAEVKKGDILVEGCIQIFDNDNNIIAYDYCEADADIYLQYQYPVKKSISRYYQYKNYTGREKEKKYLKLGNQYLSFYMRSIPYLKYDVAQEETQWKLLKDIYLPVYAGKRIYKEYILIDALYSEEKAKNLLEESLNREIKELNEKGVQIIENNVKIDKNNDSMNMIGNLVVVSMNNKKITANEIKIENTENNVAE